MNNGWVSHFKLSRAVFLCGLLLTLGGCSDNSTSSNTVDTATYLFYAPQDSSSNYATVGGFSPYGLKAVDPAYPNLPIRMFSSSTLSSDFGSNATCTATASGFCESSPGDVSPFQPAMFMGGTVNASSNTISDLHYRYVLFTNGNSLIRIDAEKNGGLGLAQVSNESQIAGDPNVPTPGICYSDSSTQFSWSMTDYVNPLNSVFIYRKDPDGTGDCSTTPGNDRLFIVKLSDDSATAPSPAGGIAITAATEPIAPVYNTDGSLNSILMWAPGLLSRYSLDGVLLQSLVASGLTAKPIVIGLDGEGRILLGIRNGTGTHVRQYDSTTLTFNPASLYDDASNSIQPYFASDGTYAYFHDNQKIYRVPFDASASASVVADESGTFTGGLIRAGWSYTIFTTVYQRVPDIHLSGNNLVYVYDDSSGATPAGTSNQVYVRSVPKTGGTPKTIYTFPDNAEMLSWRAAYGRVYLSRSDVKTAVSVGDTGASPQVYDQSWWLGFTFDSTARLFSEARLNLKGKARDLTPKTIFRAQYDPSTGDLPADLISYDANTTSQLIDFGVPAPTFGSYTIGGPPDTLGVTTRERTLMAYDGIGGGNDVLYLNARNKSTMTVVDRDNTQFVVLVGINNGGGCSFGNGRFDPLLPALILLSAVYIWRRRKSWRTNQ